MKKITVTGIMAICIGLASYGNGGELSKPDLVVAEWNSGEIPLKDLGSQSQIIVYAAAVTNNLPKIHFVVVEDWKGAHEASTAGITNGMQVPRPWPDKTVALFTNAPFSMTGQWTTNDGPLPDGEVVFYQRSSNSVTFRIRSEYVVRSGRIGAMTIPQFKRALGL